ncbi:MAG: phosphosulfolactate synthase [Pirellulaceae bacterium]|nr:phosphosulfolactate synthase [Pirellulaceae bacterium]
MFLDLPDHEAKPRTRGLTCCIDAGVPVGMFCDYMASIAPHIDFVKFGWGTGILTPRIAEKIASLQEHDISYWFGGTLFELSYRQNRLDEFVAWVKDHGATYIEISDGTIPLAAPTKLELIERLAQDFRVLSEVGSKDAQKIMSPARWIEGIRSELNAGAWRVVAEGRESGTAGIFRDTGEIRAGLVMEIVEAGIDIDKIMFEAPQKSQQAWLIKMLGVNVNLSNIALADATNVETLRLGLRFDTIDVEGNGDDYRA